VAVSSTLPLALAVLDADAREDAAVEAVGVALVNDEVAEVGRGGQVSHCYIAGSAAAYDKRKRTDV
jgi:hypothetical protein